MSTIINTNFDLFCSCVKSGDTIAIRGNSFISKGIRKITHGNISHVGIAMWMDGRLWLVEMDGIKNVIIPLSQYSDTQMSLYDSPMGVPPNVNDFIWSHLQYERNYSWVNFFKLFLTLLLSHTPHLPRSTLYSEICTEFNMTFYRYLGWVSPIEGYSLPPDKFCEALGEPSFIFVPHK
jgi:hypothetical protein